MVDRNKIWDLLGAFTGVIFAILMVVGLGIAGSADVEPYDPSAQIAMEFVEQSDQTELGAMIGLVGVAFFFGFLAYFRRRLQQAEGDGGWLTSMAYGGGLVTAAMLLVLLSMQLAITSVSVGVDSVVAKVFATWFWNSVLVFAPPMIAFTLGGSLIIVRYGVLPRWIGWMGFLVTLTLLAPWIGAAVTLVWILLASLVLTYQAWRTPGGVSD